MWRRPAHSIIFAMPRTVTAATAAKTQMMRLEGVAATTAWVAYTNNISFFGGPKQVEYAKSLPHPATIFLLLPDRQMPESCGVTGELLVAQHLGREASAVVLLSAPTPNRLYTLIYVHVRTNQHGGGFGSRLITAGKREVGDGTLQTRAAACRTHYATLLLLRNGFMADIALFKADIPLPGGHIAAGSTELDLWWHSRIGASEQLEFVRQAYTVQSKRRSERARAYAAELQLVLQRLEEVTAEAEPATPKRKAPQDWLKRGYTVKAKRDRRLPTGWTHLQKPRPSGRMHSRFVAPDGITSTDRMSVVFG
jgi:hypothetical protein